MAIKLSTGVRNARIGAVESAIGTSAVLKIRSGTVPANITDADAGTVLVSITLPADWLGAAANGAVAKAGTWSGTGAAAGTAGHFRIYASDGTTQHMQGTVTATGGGGDMTLDNTSIAVSQTVTISGFTLTDGNA